MKRSLCPAAALPALFALTLVGCEASKSQNPLSPSVAGPLAGVDITAPRLLEPAQGFKVKQSQQPLKLLIENSTSTGVRPIAYSFEVASDSEFQAKVYARSGVPTGDGGRTSVTVDRLDLGRPYYWRVRAEDGANNSAYSTASFEVLPKPVLNPPPQNTPINGVTTGSRRPELIVGQAERNAAIGSLRYEFQIASDAGFGSIVADGSNDEGSGNTGFTPGGDLSANTQYFWRVRATDGETTSSWSDTQTFRTPQAAAPPAPGPPPAPGGGPCDFSSGQAIVECERRKYGHMGPGEIIAFLRAVADSLNRNGLEGGRFGLLLKDGGNNCGGYSCDILCSGQGGGQRQWDVLSDSDGAQGPMWGELERSHIVSRVCEIR